MTSDPSRFRPIRGPSSATRNASILDRDGGVKSNCSAAQSNLRIEEEEMASKTPRLEDFAEWNQQNQRLLELQGKRDAADKRVQELLGHFNEANAPMTVSERQERARAMVVRNATALR